MSSIADVNKERKTKNKTHLNTFDMFPVGTRVKVICVCQDMTFFDGSETGVVVKNSGEYLGIIVKFDKQYNRHDFNFAPDDLIVLETADEIVNKAIKKIARSKKVASKPTTFNNAAQQASLAVANLVISKQRDYGTKNILNSPVGAETGVIVRLYDKLARLANLLEKGTTPNNESIDDTINDIMGYGLVLKMVRENTFTLPLTED